MSNSTFIDQVGDFLAANSVGVVGTSIFISSLPPTPTVSVGLYLQGGSESPNKTADKVLFQVLVRDTGYAAGLARAETVWNLLRNSWGLLSSVKGRVEAENQPGVFFRDDNELFVFSLNFQATIPKQ